MWQQRSQEAKIQRHKVQGHQEHVKGLPLHNDEPEAPARVTHNKGNTEYHRIPLVALYGRDPRTAHKEHIQSFSMHRHTPGHRRSPRTHIGVRKSSNPAQAPLGAIVQQHKAPLGFPDERVAQQSNERQDICHRPQSRPLTTEARVAHRRVPHVAPRNILTLWIL